MTTHQSTGDGPCVPATQRRFWFLGMLGATLPAGTRVALPGCAVTVTETTPDGRPAAARFRFAEPLEDERYCWLAWDWTSWAYERLRPPSPGARKTLSGPF